MSDFLDWSMQRQNVVIHEIRSILKKYHIPYVYRRLDRPARSINLVTPGCDAQALMAVYVEQDRIIDELRRELFKLRGMTKSEWKSEEEAAEDLLHSTKRI
jgi:hypothetical protein